MGSKRVGHDWATNTYIYKPKTIYPLEGTTGENLRDFELDQNFSNKIKKGKRYYGLYLS